MMVYGYIRVSTQEQNEDRQTIALRRAGIENENIYMDKQSGRDFNRPMYKRLVKRLKENDTLFVKSIDRWGKDLIGTFLSDLVLQVLSFVAENERKNIRDRQREGIQAARERGVQFGRPPKPLPGNFGMVYSRWISKEISGREAAVQCGMPISSFYRKARSL